MTSTSTIVGYHRDEEEDWVAELSCGHCQHVRHRPPFVERSWVLTEAGRAAKIGQSVVCPECARAQRRRESATKGHRALATSRGRARDQDDLAKALHRPFTGVSLTLHLLLQHSKSLIDVVMTITCICCLWLWRSEDLDVE